MPESDVKSILKDAWKKTSEPGDKICFYATGNGVIADATVSSFPEKKFDPAIHDLDRYPWVFRLEAGKICLDNPVIIDAALRANLDAFKGRDPNKPWACFVQSTGKLSKHDFDVHREN